MGGWAPEPDVPCACRHLPKCFDNVHNLEFEKDEAGNPTKTAVGMYSGERAGLCCLLLRKRRCVRGSGGTCSIPVAGEGEYVAFAGECSCDGPVEVWLQNVVDAMRAALSAEFKAALPAYEERPRTRWLLENSVQNTVVVSRAFFTCEVNAAFAELEEGNEHALKVCLPGSPAALPLACWLHLLHAGAAGS